MLQLLESFNQTIALSLLGAVGLVLLFLLVLSLRQRIIAKMGLRNIPRRPAQSALIVLGLTLATVIIVSSLAIGDTLSYSLRRQAVDAYGQIDEVLAPPILGTLANLGVTPSDGEAELENVDLFAGGLTTVVALLQDGLPGIDQGRYDELAAAIDDEPLIDGVAPAILFPTIIRNRTTGQGEPYGFLMGVEEAYPEQFGMISIDGSEVNPTELRSGAGTVFDVSANLFAATGDATQSLITTLSETGILSGDTLGITGDTGALGGAEGDAPEINAAQIALGAAAIGGALIAAAQGDAVLPDNATPSLQEQPSDNPDNPGSVPLETGLTLTDLAEQLGIDEAFLREQLTAFGIDEFLIEEQLAASGIDPANLNPEVLTNQLLSAINLNTIGEDIDEVLGQAGLELRQGEVYLSRTGAERLKAQRGDLLDIFIGPIPVPYRVADIVDQAGPPAALAPVVVMDMAEAQRLLFMEERINAVLISNLGDELEGMALTDQVQDRLRVLSINQEAADQLIALLRQPELQPAVKRAVAEGLRDNPFVLDEDEQEGMLGALLQTAGEVLNVDQFGNHLTAIQAVVEAETWDAGSMEPLLIEALANRNVQFWMLGELAFELPSEQEEALSLAVSQLTELEVLEPLSKESVITVAGIGGSAFSSVFWLFGFFSILSGILLIFMIFVMLAAERRSEMGMARAIGMQRRQLVQMFVTEGTVYDLLAAAVGVALGLAVSYAMVGFVGSLLGQVADSLNDQIQVSNILTFHFRAAPLSMIIAYCLGVLLTFIVVTFASYRVSRLNIVAAVRDLPEENFTRRVGWLGWILRLLAGPAFLALGGWIVWNALAPSSLNLTGFNLRENVQQVVWLQLGVTALIIGVAFLLGWILSLTNVRTNNRQRLVYSIIGIGLLATWVMPWSRLILGEGGIFEQDPAAVLLSFALSGPLIILGAILAVIFNADAVLWGINRILGGIGSLTPVLRTAIAYPLNNRFRTGMAMLLFAMVITTVVIMAVVIQATQTVVTPSEERYIGFEIQVSDTLLSFFNPINDLEGQIALTDDFPADQVAAIGRIREGDLRLEQIRIDDSTDGVTQYTNARFSGVSAGLVQQAQQYHSFQMRAPGFESDAAIWEALATRTDVAVVMPGFVEEGSGNAAAGGDDFGSEFEAEFEAEFENEFEGGGRSDRWRPRMRSLPNVTLGDEALPNLVLSVTDDREAAPAPVDVQIIGVLDSNIELLGNEILVNDQLMVALEGEFFDPSAFYVKVAEGASESDVAEAIERSFTSGGLNATLLAESFAAGQAVTRGVLRLFQGFMGLGLLVGIAALGVISSRTVVERRQQVGMLRAIGYQPSMVALSFLLEASFIALGGILIGTVTGIVLGQNMVGEFFAAIAGESIPVPWGQIGIILLIAYGASLLTTILPAIQASRIYPAEALRYE